MKGVSNGTLYTVTGNYMSVLMTVLFVFYLSIWQPEFFGYTTRFVPLTLKVPTTTAADNKAMPKLGLVQ